MITTADLKSHTKADLTKMAKRLGVTGCSSMLKQDLVKAVAKASRAKEKAAATATKSKAARPKPKATSQTKAKATSSRASKSIKASTSKNGAVKSNGAATNPKPEAKPKRIRVDGGDTAIPKKVVSTKKAKPKPKPKAKPTNPRVLKKIRALQLQQQSDKDIAYEPRLVKAPGASESIWEKEPQRDRVALFVRDAFWMHASWDITRQAIERAKAALAEQWHAAKPVLRLLKLEEEGSSSETVQRDIEIHGGVRNWYIDWTGVEASFRVMVGYSTPNGRFHCICESNVVTTPNAGAADEVEDHWSDVGADAEKIFALSGGYDKERETADLKEVLEDRVQRELGAPALAKLGAAAQSPFRRGNGFHFDMDIELVVYGSTVPDGYLTLNGEPVTLRDDGTFAMRLPFPDRRQVLPAVAVSRDGSQERMIVIAVERNTKMMEPVDKERSAIE
ncbi:MAG: DUF4912 domain-containing protein [Planctomycetota bacterium]